MDPSFSLYVSTQLLALVYTSTVVVTLQLPDLNVAVNITASVHAPAALFSLAVFRHKCNFSSTYVEDS